MYFDSYKYAGIFEKLACRIIEKEISEKILVSGTTQKTRDHGIDSIIYTTQNYITIEAKLRKSSSSLGLKDIASSVIFYLLRLNDKHYIVSNVYLTADTIKVLDRLNSTKGTVISYIDGESTINTLKEIKDTLDADERELADILLQQFDNGSKRINSSPADRDAVKTKTAQLESQQKLLRSVIAELMSGRKCVILSGKTGTGKSSILNEIIEQIKQNYNTIFIDCQKYCTIEAFMYQVSNLEIGIDINHLISEYITLSEKFEDPNSLVNIKSDNILKTLAQVLSTNKYADNIKFIAKEYINNLVERFNMGNLYIFIDNYSSASPELADFIASYIISSVENLKFFIIQDTDIESANSNISEISKFPVNAERFKELHICNYDSDETDIFISFFRPDLPKSTKQQLYSQFGGNLLMIKLALDEMENKKIYNPSLLRPSKCEQIYDFRIKNYAKSDDVYVKAFFVCWILNSQIPRDLLNSLGKSDINSILKRTGLFNESNTSLSLCNPCVYKVISTYYTYNSKLLYYQIKEFADAFNAFKLAPIEQIRVKFFSRSNDFVQFADQNIALFENKSEYNNVLETRTLIFLYTNKNDTQNYIDAAANLLYASIDHSTYILDLDVLIQKISDFFKEYFEETDIFHLYDKFDDTMKTTVSNARIKYVIYLYFNSTHKNNFKQANSDLDIPNKYLLHCDDPILISKLIRFQAICQKEMGNREKFFEILRDGVMRFSHNKYLAAVYSANIVAAMNHSNPQKAVDIIDKEALPAAHATDKQLELWILNDKLINSLFIRHYDEELFENDYRSVIFMSERLCSIKDQARAENTYGAFQLKMHNNRSLACEYFKSAFYLICRYVNNFIAFYFGVNYISMIPTTQKEEFEYIADILITWCQNNIKYIINKINDPSTLPQNNKLIMALYSLENALNKRKDYRYKLVAEMSGLSDIFANKIPMSETFYIRNIPIILF